MYTIIPTEQFAKDVKHYIKKKKFISIGKDIKRVTDELEQGNLIGDEVPNLNKLGDGHIIKVRAANSDMKVGQSNGYRILYYAIKDDMEIYLLTIYYKKDDNRIPSDIEISSLVDKYCT